MLIVLYSFIVYTLFTLGLATAIDKEDPGTAKYLIDLIILVIVVIVTTTLVMVGFE